MLQSGSLDAEGEESEGRRRHDEPENQFFVLRSIIGYSSGEADGDCLNVDGEMRRLLDGLTELQEFPVILRPNSSVSDSFNVRSKRSADRMIDSTERQREDVEDDQQELARQSFEK